MKKLMILGFIFSFLLTVLSVIGADEINANSILDSATLDEMLDFSEKIALGPLFIEEITGFDAILDSFDERSFIDFELGFTIASAYIWRGQRLGDNRSFQPYITLSPSFEPLGDISFTYWADITKDTPNRQLLEEDFVVDYNFDVLEALVKFGYDEGKHSSVLNKIFDFNFDAGYIYYNFPPSGGTKSQEVYFGVEYDLPLHPSAFIYHDWDRGNGIWYEFGIAQDINLGVFPISTYAKLGYNYKQWGQTDGFSTLDCGASVPFAIGKHMTIEPFVSYVTRLKSTYNAGTDLTHDELYGGLNWSITF